MKRWSTKKKEFRIQNIACIQELYCKLHTFSEIKIDVLLGFRLGKSVRRFSLLSWHVKESVFHKQLGDVIGLVDGRVRVETEVVDANSHCIRTCLKRQNIIM